MTSFILDTYKVITRLKANGYTEQQAESFVGVLNELDCNHFATKLDVKDAVHELKLDIASLRTELTRWMFAGFASLFIAILSLMFKAHL